MASTSTISLPESPSDGASATKSHKRKGDDVFIETPANHVVVVDGNNGMSRIDALKVQLKTRRNQYNDEAMGKDPLLEELKAIGADDQEAIQAMMKESEQVQSKLNAQINEAQAACQQESSVLAQLTISLHGLEQNRDKLLQDMDEIDQRQVELQQQIALHQKEASEEIEYIDSVDEDRKREVPRLKHTISLYASTTGIKWDFSQEEILAGSVVRIVLTQGATFFVTL